MTYKSLPSMAEFTEAFELLVDWEDRYRFLMDVGEQLPPLPPVRHTEDNRVQGCVSKVWIVAQPTIDDPCLLEYAGDSETATIKGLVAILISLYSRHTPAEIMALDADDVFDKLGLYDHLSPTRHVGVYAMVEHIKSLAQRHQLAGCCSDGLRETQAPTAAER